MYKIELGVQDDKRNTNSPGDAMYPHFPFAGSKGVLGTTIFFYDMIILHIFHTVAAAAYAFMITTLTIRQCAHSTIRRFAIIKIQLRYHNLDTTMKEAAILNQSHDDPLDTFFIPPPWCALARISLTTATSERTHYPRQTHRAYSVQVKPPRGLRRRAAWSNRRQCADKTERTTAPLTVL